jgi:hypothetical protein
VAGPRQLWKTEITIWSQFDPRKVKASRLALVGEVGDAYISKAHSELVSSPYEQDDGPPEDFFECLDDVESQVNRS